MNFTGDSLKFALIFDKPEMVSSTIYGRDILRMNFSTFEYFVLKTGDRLNQSAFENNSTQQILIIPFQTGESPINDEIKSTMLWIKYYI